MSLGPCLHFLSMETTGVHLHVQLLFRLLNAHGKVQCLRWSALSLFLFKFIFPLYAGSFCLYACVPHVYLVPVEAKGVRSLELGL